MNYHQPDSHWQIFAIDGFETYTETAVVKGQFHPCVPEEVVEAYKVAEYMMAFAWYHSPLYQEALSKVLRIIEMAVKIRCRQLQISLLFKKLYKGAEKEEKRPLKQLMDELIKAEPEKNLATQFEVARSLRNSLMHPDRNNFSGAMSKGYIKQSVSLLNTLFLSSALFTSFQQHLSVMNKQLNSLQSRPLILEVNDMRVLLEDVTIKAAVCVSNEWHYLLACYPLITKPEEVLKQGIYPEPLCYFSNSLNVSKEKITAQIEDSNQVLIIIPTDHPANVCAFKAWLQTKEALSERDSLMLKHYAGHKVDECENEFWFTRLHKVIAS